MVLFIYNYRLIDPVMSENENHLNYKKDFNSFKTFNSEYTNISSSEYLKQKKFTLNNCSSSVSLYENDLKSKNTKERKLVIKLLHAKSNTTLDNVLQQMKVGFNKMIKDSPQIPPFAISPVFTEFSAQYKNADPYILNYYIDLYLGFMGYKSHKNKQYILNRARLRISIGELAQAARFYDNFGSGFVEERRRFEILMKTLLNGWEYFIEEMYTAVKNKTQKKVKNIKQ